MYIPFGGYTIIFVGDFQQLSPIGDSCLYKILFHIKFFDYSWNSSPCRWRKTKSNIPKNYITSRGRNIITRGPELSGKSFPQIAHDASDPIWDDAAYFFHEKIVPYNVERWIAYEKKISDKYVFLSIVLIKRTRTYFGERLSLHNSLGTTWSVGFQFKAYPWPRESIMIWPSNNWNS